MTRLDDVWEALRGLGEGEWRHPSIRWVAIDQYQPTLFDFVDGWSFLRLACHLGRWVWPEDLRVDVRLESGGLLESGWLESIGMDRIEVVNLVGLFDSESVAVIPGLMIWGVQLWTSDDVDDLPVGGDGIAPDVPSPAEDDPDDADLDADLDVESSEFEGPVPDAVLPFPDVSGHVEHWRLRSLTTALEYVWGFRIPDAVDRCRRLCASLNLTFVDESGG